MEEGNVHRRRQGSRWSVFCDLFADKDAIDINSSSLIDHKCSICPFPNAPRRSSSLSLSGLRYEREFWMRSAVSLTMLATGGSLPLVGRWSVVGPLEWSKNELPGMIEGFAIRLTSITEERW